MNPARFHLPSERMEDLFIALTGLGTVCGATMREPEGVVIAPLRGPGDLCGGSHRARIPPKKYLLPPKETVLVWDGRTYRRSEFPTQKLVLFGLHRCDLEAIAYLDRVFHHDPLYASRRENIFLVGLSCARDEFCSCILHESPPFCDIFLTPAGGTVEGLAFSAAGLSLLSETGITGIEEAVFTPPPAPLVESVPLPDAATTAFLASKCVSCGACSAVCPTCYCFNVREEEEAVTEMTGRIREWDNCLFCSHGKVAGGADFRRSREERFRYRFVHKLRGFGPLQGTPSCVGCGRCRVFCPVGIDPSGKLPGGP